MITSYAGQKLTPKQKANELLLDAIQVKLGYWIENEADGMTEAQIAQVQDQLEKQASRLAKLLGYDEVSHA